MEYFIFGLAAFALLAHVVATIATLRALRRRPRRASTYPKVSILKPLKGIDDQLEENLRSFFKLEYPWFELIFCAPEHEASAREERPAHAQPQRDQQQEQEDQCEEVARGQL